MMLAQKIYNLWLEKSARKYTSTHTQTGIVYALQKKTQRMQKQEEDEEAERKKIETLNAHTWLTIVCTSGVL